MKKFLALAIAGFALSGLFAQLMSGEIDPITKLFWDSSYKAADESPFPRLILRENPVGDVLKLGFSIPVYGNAEIKIFDMHGRLVLLKRMDLRGKSLDVDVNTLHPGVYVIRVAIGPFGRTGVFLKK
ncbi:MAG TPA: T9SS type A sorting domain-containing protein [candidate division WOR-3 bacterium]|uniref:T9SS type A sorting domain-containing protein n=1 Tax=candidate division WOR-3 bacterium TaxID=2052148 RepID=A0A7C0XE15_UNCW3|nr:MAG: hypothetical protein DRQ04_02575 [Candidatus Hydrothermae bacterium]HDM90937.1 T9SS type A sorting domain-containing protein [candidate division WOR-3 bacterium]